jgi:cell filamentation protein
MEDPYISENRVLINKLGITDYNELNEAERKIGAVKLRTLDKIKITSFNEELIHDIHNFIFRDIFDWAGDYRITPLFKEELVLPRYSVPYSDPKMISHDLKRKLSDVNETKWSGMSDDELTMLFARKMALVWKVHPFRDGNTRTILSYSYLFAREHGFNMDMDVFLSNLMRIYKEDKIVRYSIRDKFVLASLDEKDYPEVQALAKVYKKALNNYRQ